MFCRQAKETSGKTTWPRLEVGEARLTSYHQDKMQEPTVQQMKELAVQLAREGATLALNRAGSANISFKADESVVTDVDHAVQSLITDEITRRYAEHAIVAEESLPAERKTPAPSDARYCWVLDPVDGTRNFSVSLPCFCTSIGILDQGHPLIGVIYEPNVDLLFVAERGRGATVNDRPLRVRNLPARMERLVGIPSGKDALSLGVIRAWMEVDDLAFRNLGSTALHLALVASGALQATFAKRCRIWDLAAGLLLVSEAGGAATDQTGAALTPFDLSLDPQSDLPCLAGTPEVHAELLNTITELA